MNENTIELKPWYKNEPFNAFWEKGYRDMSVSCMGGPSFEVLEIAQSLPINANVLDLGCGEGRNALFLASMGCKVTAIERSEAGIKKLNSIAQQNGIQLKALVQDIGQIILEEEYDCVLSHGVLYYLERPLWQKLLLQVKQKTKPGGFNIFTLFIYNENYPCTDEIQSAHYQNSFLPNEIQQFYQDWNEIRFDQYVKWDSHPGIPMHYHPIEKLVSQKPAASYSNPIIKEPIISNRSLSDPQFQRINMGIDTSDLIHLIGSPDIVDRQSANGIQYGMSLHSPTGEHPATQSTMEGYILELWYYGKHVIYITNGLVSGKALYSTPPVKIRTRR